MSERDTTGTVKVELQIVGTAGASTEKVRKAMQHGGEVEYPLPLAATVLLRQGDDVVAGGWCDADGRDDVYALMPPSAGADTPREEEARVQWVGRGTLELRDASMGEYGSVVLRWRGREWSMPDALLCVEEAVLPVDDPHSAEQNPRAFTIRRMMILGAREQLLREMQGRNAADAPVSEGGAPSDAVTRRRMYGDSAHAVAEYLLLMRDAQAQRAQAGRDDAASAVRVPSDAAQLLPLVTPAAAGKSITMDGVQVPAGVHGMLQKRVRVTGGHFRTGDVDGKRVPVKVTVELQQSRGRVARVQIETRALESLRVKRSEEVCKWYERIQQPLLTGLEPRGVTGELRALALQAVVNVVGARRILWLLALMGIVAERGKVRLHADGTMPEDVRLELMRRTGCRPKSANKKQGDLYREFLRLVLDMQLIVTPTGRGGKRRRRSSVPQQEEPERTALLTATRHRMRDGEVMMVTINPELVDHWMQVPEALLQITDADDPEGVMRALGLAIVTRLEMAAARGEAPKQERLQLLLERAGLLEWVERTSADPHYGRAAMKRELERALHELTRLPKEGRRAPTDAVGRVKITWGEGKRWLSSAKLTMVAAPPWHRELHAEAKAPPALPAAGS